MKLSLPFLHPKKLSSHFPKKQVFPSIYRFITELPGVKHIFRHKIAVFMLVCLVLIGAIGWSGYQLQQTIEKLNHARIQRLVTMKELAYWQKVVKEHKDYRDGYIKLSVLSYALGEKSLAKMYIAKAIQIDPYYRESQEIAQKIDSAR